MFCPVKLKLCANRLLRISVMLHPLVVAHARLLMTELLDDAADAARKIRGVSEVTSRSCHRLCEGMKHGEALVALGGVHFEVRGAREAEVAVSARADRES
jgi:hypothetical protein